MGTHSVLARLGSDAQAAFELWRTSVRFVSFHLRRCRRCDLLMMRCPTGMLAAEMERMAWARWNAARNAEVAS